jgi:serine phosphatase RsbU (regulator of sigma subunit)
MSNDNNKKSNELYSSEEKVINRVSELLAGPIDDISILKKEFSSLLYSYRKLVRQTKKLVSISDTTQERLNQVSREKSEAYDKLNSVYTQLKEDLEFAETIQQNILPRNLEKINGVDISAKFKPMIEVGGDIYDIEEMPSGKIRIFLADATGHGVQAALITMIIKSEYEKLKNIAQTPKEIMEGMNNVLFDTYDNLKQNFTAFAVDIDTKQKSFQFASAGHPEQYVIIDGAIEKLQVKGPILGFMQNIEYGLGERNYNDKFKLFLFTDGIFEEFDEDYNEYGIERLFQCIKTNSTLSAGEILNIIFNDVLEHIGSILPNDDILMIASENN